MKKIFFSALIFFLLSIPAFPQTLICDESDEGGFGDRNCDTNIDSPLDGGVSILLGLSTLYAVRRFKSSRKI